MNQNFRVFSDWRSKYFGLPTRSPHRDPPSNELLAVRELMKREDQRAAEMLQRAAENDRVRREREAYEQLREDVERFGADVVLTLMLRVDPTFELPPQLRIQKEH